MSEKQADMHRPDTGRHNGPSPDPVPTRQPHPLWTAPRAAEGSGYIDGWTDRDITGWCWNPAAPNIQVEVVALADGVEAARTPANLMRGDLAEAGIGNGAHGFRLEFPHWLLDGVPRLVKLVAAGVGELPNSPISLQSINRPPLHLLDQIVERLPADDIAAADSARMLRAYLRQAETLLPQSVPLTDYAGWRQVFAAVPTPLPIPDALGPGRDRHREVALALTVGSETVIAVLDTGAELLPGALHRALDIFQRKGADLLYGDVEVTTPGGLRPWFRPDWNYDLFLAQDYMRGLVLVRASLFGTEPLRAEAAWLKMRALERARPGAILHLPEILASLDGPPADEAQWLDLLQTHLTARAGARIASITGHPGLRRVQWPAPASPPLISLIITSNGGPDRLEACVESILSRTSHRPFEIIIADNPRKPGTCEDYLRRGREQGRFRVLTYDEPPNRADMANQAAGLAHGDILGFIDDTLELLSPRWLETVSGLLARPEVAAVGGRLRFANGMVQHAGIVLGGQGLVSYAFQHQHVDDEGYFGRARVAGNYSAVTGVLFCRTAQFRAAGGFDAVMLPDRWHDIDLCLQWRATGKLVVCTPEIELLCHAAVGPEGGADAASRARTMRAESFLRERWHKALLHDPYYNPNLNLDRYPFTGLAVPPRHVWGADPVIPSLPLHPLADGQDGGANRE